MFEIISNILNCRKEFYLFDNSLALNQLIFLSWPDINLPQAAGILLLRIIQSFNKNPEHFKKLVSIDSLKQETSWRGSCSL
jgi:hypothetical protein